MLTAHEPAQRHAKCGCKGWEDALVRGFAGLKALNFARENSGF
jgi:hypothetical protein